MHFCGGRWPPFDRVIFFPVYIVIHGCNFSTIFIERNNRAVGIREWYINNSISLYLGNRAWEKQREDAYYVLTEKGRSYCGKLWLFCSGGGGGCVANKSDLSPFRMCCTLCEIYGYNGRYLCALCRSKVYHV